MKAGRKKGSLLSFRFRCRWLILPSLALTSLLIVCGVGAPSAQERCSAEDYCQRCHEPHDGIDMEVNTCQTCHELVRQGPMDLYPWYSSEAALAGICCSDCHGPECGGNDCLSCHRRHADPLR